ncbi:hypothetical protein BH09ACT12_BH09ACT12_11860 [soil metagenome]
MTTRRRSPVPADRAPSANARIVFRVVGTVLLLVGLFFAIRGGIAFFDEMDSMSADSGPGSILMLAGGGFLVIFGLAALNAGFLGAQASYASGETAPAVREFGSALRGDPVVPTSESATDEEKDGPFCSECGVRADREARFCDACGHALAPR